MNKNSPIRTCVSCKSKMPQIILKRYRVISGVIQTGKGDGRSFYLCDKCLQKDEKILKKILDRYIKSVIGLEASNLKEKLLNEQC
ncbi:DUF448 domain-containing protein [Campylobacter sp. RM9344]|uniref:DUF448 domain-containing protein n=1 Tax=Campylobacter californiensis TaxID=1032243 RepID=A0AAW3ZRP8_9BACT|nr:MULTISPECIES: DUF448 domain-containing protein [unclassified Campylobacter]MBE2984386.1 DUF448 domain-containing protein [Campylobacter sp. RM6883]MBE2985724.1 DUF448 domain-containing protein [Campylobacter sp. RM12919]MBE2988756.1 DUF448 domain-containing protein [Campylobacter sp. RM12920]MBE2995821.1 DUF448 domain-containing protein [Campylobacter sp. RM6913]MBE3021772.1 DUF448 domain-containing protein [Campylobacter sp. 7477a]MBE3029652.1 DUF448 domain-containing protein [Campylobact